MKTALIAEGLDGYIRLNLGKGCIAKFRAVDYYAALAAGKAEQRALRQARRETHRQAQADAARLLWITEDRL